MRLFPGWPAKISFASETTLLTKERDRSQLRALLREASYLPDLHARTWVTRHIIFRYRQYDGSPLDGNDPAETRRVEEKRTEARKAFRKLCRANQGERKVLSKVLLLAYGRTGRRKRELMQPLMRSNNNPETQSASDEISCVTRKSERDAAIAVEIGMLPGQLKGLAQSQIAAAPPLWLGRNPKRLTAEIPATNAWGRPMPANRKKNLTKKWYAKLLHRLRPPLPEDEWEDLKAKAQGKIDLELPVRRRWPVYRTTHQPSPLSTVVMTGKASDQLLRSSPEGVVTKRLMRRIYEAVFAECAKMTWDGEKKDWNVSWGVTARKEIQ